MQIGIRPFEFMSCRGRNLPVCLLVFCVGWPWPIYAQDPTPSFRAQSDVVLVDLIVTDQRGNFVADLNRDEIEVFEDGKRQELQFFRLERTDSFHGEKTPVAVSHSTGGYYAFLVDLQTLTQETVQTSKAAIREFLRSKIDPRDYFMLAAVGPELRVVQPFTHNLTALEQALDQISYYPWLPPGITPHEVLYLVGRQGNLSCEALSALCRHLGSLPNRKHVLYFSRGYPLELSALVRSDPYRRSSPKATYSLKNKVLSTVDQANRSQVTIHSIDPQGLMTIPPDLRPYVSGSGLEATHEFLALLSTNTGGHLATNENDLQGPMREVYLDSRTYYIFGYVPQTKRKLGKFHEIKVRVKRENLRLRYRRGYVDHDPLVAAQSELASAFKFPNLFKDFPFNLDVVPQGGTLAVRARIPTKALRFVSEGDKNRCVLEIFGVIFDEFHEPTEKGFFLAKSVDLDFDAKGLKTFLGYETIGPWMEKDYPKKGNYLVVVVRQKLMGGLAAARADLNANGIAY